MNGIRRIALVGGVALHGLALVSLWRGGPIALTLLAHALGSAAWGYGMTAFLPGKTRATWWFPAGCALIFPGAGLFASLLLVQAFRHSRPEQSEKRYVIWNEQAKGEWSEVMPGGAAGQSIVEILQSPRTQLRRNAVLALRDLDPQMAIPLLRKGLQDSDEQVRIYAQNILSGMLERFEGGIKELEQQLRANPDAALPARRLAEQFFELVYLDVAGDDETAAHYLTQALGLLERAAAAAPADREIPLLGLKYALRARDVVSARRWSARIEPAQLDSQHVLPWRMELAFQEADWAGLRALFAAFAQGRYFNPRIDEVARFWGVAPAVK